MSIASEPLPGAVAVEEHNDVDHTSVSLSLIHIFTPIITCFSWFLKNFSRYLHYFTYKVS